MDPSLATWPVLLLPGVALLVMSTSLRMGQLHDEVIRVSESRFAEERALAGRMVLLRGRTFRDALRLLYAAVALLAAANLAGGLASLLPSVAPVALALTALAIASVIAAACLLIVESSRSLRALEARVAQVDARGSAP